MSADSTDVRATFVAFRKECIWLRTCYDTFYALFGDNEENERVLRSAAPVFFTDLNVIFIEYWVLVVSRITDPAKSMGRENLTVQNLMGALASSGDSNPAIEATAKALQDYRALVVNGRNRIVSHADKEAFLANSVLGAHAEADLCLFLRNLQLFNDLVGETVGEGPLDFTGTSEPGDAYDLIRALKTVD